MSTAELIEVLKKLPLDAEVLFNEEGEWRVISDISFESGEVRIQ